MSVIRFVHTDHLRLGTPLAGLADCPDWLRKSAASAVRKSVANVVEAAIASRSQFVVIAGRIADADQDLDIAVRWLASQAEQLMRHGIRLVLTGHEPREHAVLQRLNAVVCHPHQEVEVWMDYAGNLQLQVHSAGTGRRNAQSLLLLHRSHGDRSGSLASAVADFSYTTVPGIAADPAPPVSVEYSLSGIGQMQKETAAQQNRCLVVTAGAPQAVRPSEQGVFGCRLVEADTQHRTLAAQFCATDAFRYAQQTIHCHEQLTAAGLVSAIAERSRNTSALTGRTVVVDWTVKGALLAEVQCTGDLDEPSLLGELRKQLQAGHAGVWPRRIVYSDETQFSSTRSHSLAVQEFLSIMAERRTQGLQGARSYSSVAGVVRTPYSGCDTVAGLELLSRVA